ncbi:hypothetical protein Emed_007215 [Eimeria media]
MVCESSADVLLVSSVASLLQQLASQNKSTGCGAPCFLSASEPMITVADYVERLARFFQCSKECFILALIYIDRLLQSNNHVWLCPLNVHRLVVTALMVAVKFADDTFYSNAYYAKVGGLPVKEINYLEATLLRMLRFRLHVLPCEFERFYRLVMDASFSAGAAPRPPRAIHSSSSNSSSSSSSDNSSSFQQTSKPHIAAVADAGAGVVDGGDVCSSLMAAAAAPADDECTDRSKALQHCCSTTSCCSPSTGSTACFSGSSQSVSPPCTPEAADEVHFPSVETAVSSGSNNSRCCCAGSTSVQQRIEEESSCKCCRHQAAAAVHTPYNARLQQHVHPNIGVGIHKESTTCTLSLTQQHLIDFSAAPSRSVVEQVDAKGPPSSHF